MERARKAEDKEERRRAILDAARAELGKSRFQELQMAEVARRAGLAKGTLYLYFETREALALGLLEELLGGWFAELDQALLGARRPEPRKVAHWMLDALEGRPPLLPLLAVLQSVLEHNLPKSEARRFKEHLLRRVLATGELLEQALKHLAPGEGARLILQANALAVGLYGMAEPAPVVAEVLSEPALSPLRVEFASEFVDVMDALLSRKRRDK
jgi:AcrR family transcriptional regulator